MFNFSIFFSQSEVMYNKFPLLLPYPVQDHNGCISLFGLLVDLAVQCLYHHDLTKGLVKKSTKFSCKPEMKMVYLLPLWYCKKCDKTWNLWLLTLYFICVLVFSGLVFQWLICAYFQPLKRCSLFEIEEKCCLNF